MLELNKGQKESPIRFSHQLDNSGLNFLLPTAGDMARCLNCDASIDATTLTQYAVLTMLAESGVSSQFKNGFFIDGKDLATLDSHMREVLDLPLPWSGSFDAEIKRLTHQSSFAVTIHLLRTNGKKIFYKLDSVFIRISDDEYYLPSPAQRTLLDAVIEHSKSSREEYDNLWVLYQLQQAKHTGCNIDLHHFSETKLVVPEEISVIGEVSSNGDLNLNPEFGLHFDFTEVEQRLGQLDHDAKVQSFRVGDTFVLLDQKKLDAVHEIIKNRHIPQKNVKQFLASPTQFLNGALIDLDLGFSARMHGATAFKHAYFGDTEKSGMSWFESILQKEEPIPPSQLKALIEDEEEFFQVSGEIRNAMKKGATVFPVRDVLIDISDETVVEQSLAETYSKVQEQSHVGNGDEAIKEQVVVDVDLNDVKADFGKPVSAIKGLEDLLYLGELDTSNLARKPYPHQSVGIRWILGLAEEGLMQLPKDASCGGMLADDMGLGKTYMALVAASEILAKCKKEGVVERPILVVAPKSLLGIWEKEIGKTFHKNPFDDVIILQGEKLTQYKQKGSSKETMQVEGEINFSLKVGGNFGMERLDQPKRLVLVTYETLRNFQFSLCSVDWGMIIFDEAQYIKNPNAIVTRAAKGLKSCFKLVATGTPVENSLADFWCLLDTACPNTLGSYQDFKKSYIDPIMKAEAEDKLSVQESVGKQLRQVVGRLMLRRMKEDELQGLPHKYIHVGIETEKNYKPSLQQTMKGKQLSKYNAVVHMVSELKRSGKKGVALSGLAQLRSVSLHPYLGQGSSFDIPNCAEKSFQALHESGKLGICYQTLQDIQKKGEKVIIFLVNKQLQSQLKVMLTQLFKTPVHIINGDTKTVARNKQDTREGLILDFESREGFAIIIMSPIAAGTGLTITEANHVIHLERHWNPAKEAQATDRAYRIGQKKDVHVYLPILKHPDMDSFDVNLHQLLSSKVELKDAIIIPEEVNPEALFSKSLNLPVQRPKQLRGEDLYELDWREFEALCAVLFAKEFQGEGCLTPRSGDSGADVYITGEITVLVECKHKNKKEKYCEIDPITRADYARKEYRDIIGEIDRFILASNAQGFGWKVRRQAKKHKVELYGCEQIDDLLKKHIVTEVDIQRKLCDGT